MRHSWAIHKETKNKILNGQKEVSIVKSQEDKLYPQCMIPGFAMYPCGGKTELHITSPDNKNYYLNYTFNRYTPYNKKLGVEKALEGLECFYYSLLL